MKTLTAYAFVELLRKINAKVSTNTSGEDYAKIVAGICMKELGPEWTALLSVMYDVDLQYGGFSHTALVDSDVFSKETLSDDKLFHIE